MDTPQINALGNFVYAITMLKKIPRSGFAFLGSGSESVASHVYGAAAIGYVLGKMAGVDAQKVAVLCLFHDLHEASTGDFNYVNHRYDRCDATKALDDMSLGTGLENEVKTLYNEFETDKSAEAALARDADQLDMICSLKRELAAGNEFAKEWLESAVKRISTEAGKKLCNALMENEPHNWWYGNIEKSWWINHKK